MPWVRLDDQLHAHPKLALLGPLILPCLGLHTLALSWSAAYLTDGLIPAEVVERLAGHPEKQNAGTLPGFCQGPEKDPSVVLTSALVRVGLWHRNQDGSYLLHDYLDYNPSRKQVLQERRSKAKSGRLGGLARAKSLLGVRQGKLSSKTVARPDPSPSATNVAEPSADSRSKSIVADIDFVAALKGNPAYRGIDVDREIGKCQAWLLTPKGGGGHRKLTRGTLVNWLNRIDRELGPNLGTARHAEDRPAPLAIELTAEEQEENARLAKKAIDELTKKMSRT